MEHPPTGRIPDEPNRLNTRIREETKALRKLLGEQTEKEVFDMLSIIFGDCPEAIYNTSMYFDNQYLDSWLEDSFAAEVIAGIEKGKILSPQAIDTKALGVIPTTKISGGAKTLLLVKNRPDQIFNASTCGDNCARFLLKIGKMQDVTINLHHFMTFPGKKFEIRIVNTGVVVHNMLEMIENAVNLL